MATLPVVETRILDGLARQYQQQFGTDLIISQSMDEVQKLALRKDGQRLKYPIAYAKLDSIASSEAPDHYVSRYLLRKGILVQIGDNGNTALNVRLLPAIFNVQITYETTATVGENSVLWYTKRWLQSARMGLLKFSILIGNVRLQIGYTMDLHITVPSDRPSPADEISSYKIITNMSLKGYMSEAILKPTGMLSNIEIEEQIGANGQRHVWNFD